MRRMSTPMGAVLGGGGAVLERRGDRHRRGILEKAKGLRPGDQRKGQPQVGAGWFFHLSRSMWGRGGWMKPEVAQPFPPPPPPEVGAQVSARGRPVVGSALAEGVWLEHLLEACGMNLE